MDLKQGDSGLPVGVKRRKLSELDKETRFLLEGLHKYIQEVEVYLDIDLSNDYKCIRGRVLSEGFGFMSKTLPRFLKWVRRCQENECFKPCPGFKRHRTKRWTKPYPRFLHGLVEFLSDGDGNLIFHADSTLRERQGFAYTAISTICQTFGAKYELPLPQETLNAQIRATFEADKDQRFDFNDLVDFLGSENARIFDLAKDIITETFSPYFHYGVYEEDGEKLYGLHKHELDLYGSPPRHGTGAVAFPCKPHEKYTHFMGFPPHFKALGNFEDLLYLPGECTDFRKPYNAPHKERSALAYGGVGRFEIVPKNAEKGRGINLEMKEFQFPQQVVKDALYAWLESCPRSSGHVNFTDQRINQRLALEASRRPKYATVDLVEASESGTRVHIDNLFSGNVEILEALNTLRSRFTRAVIRTQSDSGEGEVEEVLFQENNKYAPMGSALCFPVEAVLFWALTRAVIQYELEQGNSEDRGDHKEVWVYGDDLIFPVRYYAKVAEVFGLLGLKINEEKSFYRGPFRESCGVDAYDGIDVTPTCRLSTRLPFRDLHTTDSDHARSLVAWIEYANLFEEDGFPSVARHIRRTVCDQYPSAKSIPRLTTQYPSGGLFWLDYNGWDVREYISNMCDERDKRGHFSCGRSTLDSSYDPVYDEVAPKHVVFPFYQGKVKRTWGQSSNQYRADITENVRRLRYYCEGSEGPEASYWFSDKSDFCLRRQNRFFS
jgi:hypothetical protein